MSNEKKCIEPKTKVTTTNKQSIIRRLVESKDELSKSINDILIEIDLDPDIVEINKDLMQYNEDLDAIEGIQYKNISNSNGVLKRIRNYNTKRSCKKRYDQAAKDTWFNEAKYTFFKKDESDPHSVYCKLCLTNINVKSGKRQMDLHLQTKKHKAIEEYFVPSKTQKIDSNSCVFQCANGDFETKQYNNMIQESTNEPLNRIISRGQSYCDNSSESNQNDQEELRDDDNSNLQESYRLNQEYLKQVKSYKELFAKYNELMQENEELKRIHNNKLMDDSNNFKQDFTNIDEIKKLNEQLDRQKVINKELKSCNQMLKDSNDELKFKIEKLNQELRSFQKMNIYLFKVLYTRKLNRSKST